MLAETVIATLAIAATLYKGQQIYGTKYEQRTERLRERCIEFYAAAETLMQNPELDTLHLRKLKEMHNAMNHRAAGRIFARVAKDMHMRAKELKLIMASGAWATSDGTKLSRDTDRQLMEDFVNMADAAMLLVAERDAFWGPIILRRMRRIFRDDVQPHHRAEKVMRAMAGHGMMHAA